MAELRRDPVLMVGKGWEAGYQLLDSGNGRKLEKFGPYNFIRPDPQALWQPRAKRWSASGEFVPGSDEDGGGRWNFEQEMPEEGWQLEWEDVRFTANPTPFRHLQFFPDMAPVWEWMGEQLVGCTDADTLNLFGYTGLGTLHLSHFGKVTHVDASKKSVAQARENAALSGMEDKPIRWLVDDAAKYTAREVRRGNRYDGIILDPPKFGRGPKNETWRLEEGLPNLIGDCAKLLDDNSRFLFLTVYAVRMSAVALAGLLQEKLRHLPGVIEYGDLAVQEGSLPEELYENPEPRLLPTAIFARWSNSG